MTDLRGDSQVIAIEKMSDGCPLTSGSIPGTLTPGKGKRLSRRSWWIDDLFSMDEEVRISLLPKQNLPNGVYET